jgi:hypothetical protein
MKADRMKDGNFTGWTFFDTCCLSELVKLADTGEQARVSAFVRGLDIAVPSTVLQELRKAPVIARRVPEVFASATLWLIPHPTKFWNCDVWNFLNVKGLKRNILEASPLPAPVFGLLDSYPPLVASFERAERVAGQDFIAQVERDRKAGVNERKLTLMVGDKVNQIAKESYDIEVPVADVRPENFPALFTYYYAYYFRFLVHRHVRPHRNDFNDLAHASAAAYCRNFFAEQKLVQMLRKQVQGRVAPTPYATAKHFHAEGRIDSDAHERARKSEDMRRETSPLLLGTTFMTHMELREAVLAV